MTLKDFESSMNYSCLPKVKRHLECYLKDIPKGNRPVFQAGKMIEEIGELIQASCAGNWADEDATDYSTVRGSIESEASDVIIASLGLVSLTKERVSLFPLLTEIVDGDMTRWDMFREMCRAVEYVQPSRAISAAFLYVNSKGKDVLESVLKRLQFNEELLKEKGELVNVRSKRKAV